MPRTLNRIPRPPRPVEESEPVDDLPDPAGDVWGGDPEQFGLIDPGAPPPPPAASSALNEQASAPPAEVAALGAPPDDTVAAAKWAYQLHMRLAHDAMMDSKLTPSQRRKEVRVTLAGAAKHMTDALRYDALVAINRDREELERKRRGKAAAKMVPSVTVEASAKIIPMRRDG